MDRSQHHLFLLFAIVTSLGINLCAAECDEYWSGTGYVDYPCPNATNIHPCKCNTMTLRGASITCDGLTDRQLPNAMNGIEEPVYQLKIINYKNNSLPEGMFVGSCIEQIEIWDSPITELLPGTFRSLEGLEELRIENTQIEHLRQVNTSSSYIPK